jgi:hypothetical protein
VLKPEGKEEIREVGILTHDCVLVALWILHVEGKRFSIPPINHIRSLSQQYLGTALSSADVLGILRGMVERGLVSRSYWVNPQGFGFIVDGLERYALTQCGQEESWRDLCDAIAILKRRAGRLGKEGKNLE